MTGIEWGGIFLWKCGDRDGFILIGSGIGANAVGILGGGPVYAGGGGMAVGGVVVGGVAISCIGGYKVDNDSLCHYRRCFILLSEG